MPAPVLPTSYTALANSATYDMVGAAMPVGANLHLYGRKANNHVGDNSGSVEQWVFHDTAWKQTTIYNDASYDDRNGGGGITSSGTLLYFFRRYNGTTSTQIDTLCARSTDNGATWATAAVTPPTGYTVAVPYGPLVELPSGALLQTIYGNDGANWSSWTVKSTDDGATWGSIVHIDTVVGSTGAPTETAVAYIDGATDGASRLIAVARDSGKLYLSSDGGGTWDAGTDITTNVGSADVTKCPITPWLYLYDGYLILLYVDRNGTDKRVRYVTGVAGDVYSSVANFSSPTTVYTNNTSPENDIGDCMVFEYEGSLHVAFYDDDADTGDPNILTSLAITTRAPSGLVAWWSLDETGGARLDNHFYHNLTDNNTVGSRAGVISNAAAFVRANSEYLTLVDNADMSLGATAWSVSMWFYLDDLAATQVLIAKDNSSSQREFLIFVNTAGALQFVGMADGNTTYGSLGTVNSGDGAISAETWYHLVAWYDPSVELGIAINAGTPTTEAIVANAEDSTAVLALGARKTDASADVIMDGALDEVAIYRKVLSSAEIDYLYNGGAGRSYSQASQTIPVVMYHRRTQGMS